LNKKTTIFDDLDALVGGESFDSALGAFNEGDRIVIRDGTWDDEGITKLSDRFGIVIEVHVDETDVFVSVTLDNGHNEQRGRVYDSHDLMLFDDWIMTTEAAQASCQQCFDTTFKGHRPGTGDCPKCVGQLVDYGRSADAWREARKRRRD